MSDHERQTWPAVALIVVVLIGSAGVAWLVAETQTRPIEAKLAGMCERLGDTYPADVLAEVRELKVEQGKLKLAIYDGMDDRYRRSDHDAFVEAFLEANPDLNPPAE